MTFQKPIVKYFEYRATVGDLEETWLFLADESKAANHIMLSLIEYRLAVLTGDGAHVVEEHWRIQDGTSPPAEATVRLWRVPEHRPIAAIIEQ